jgi:hypothetical protein
MGGKSLASIPLMRASNRAHFSCRDGNGAFFRYFSPNPAGNGHFQIGGGKFKAGLVSG